MRVGWVQVGVRWEGGMLMVWIRKAVSLRVCDLVMRACVRGMMV